MAEIAQVVTPYHHPHQCGEAGTFQLLLRVALTVTLGVVVWGVGGGDGE